MLRLQPVRSPVFLAIGAGAAIVGLLPWLITGARLPLQDLWAANTLPARMPIGLLPFSQYTATLLVAVLVIGAAVAGIAGRAVPARHPGWAWLALLGGVLVVQLIALVQTAVTISRGLRPGSQSTWYLAAMVGGSVVSILLGVALVALIARAPRAGALWALGFAAIAFGSWLTGLFFPITRVSVASPLNSVLGEVTRYAPAVLVGVAVAWCGVSTVGRVIAALASLVLLVVGTAGVIAVSTVLGSRVLAHFPAELLDSAVGVFRSVLSTPEAWRTVLALAVAVAAVGLVGRWVVRRRAARQRASVPAA